MSQYKLSKTIRMIVVFIMAALMALTMAACGGGGDSGSGGAGSASGSGSSAALGGSGGVDALEEPTSAPATDAGEPQYGGEAKLVYNAFVDTNAQLGAPWFLSGSVDTTVVPMMEPLVLERNGGDIEPWLATEWVAEPENNRAIFTIREGVQFHDGSDLTPEVVAWNINQWIADSQLGANFLSAEVNDEGKVVVNMENYMSTWIISFTQRRYSIISKEAYDKYGPEEIKNNPVGTGPFLLDKVVAGQYIRFVRNDNYWIEGEPYLDSLVYTQIGDINTRNMAFQSGAGTERTDVLTLSTPQQTAEYKAMGDKVNLLVNDSGTVFLLPDSIHEDSPLSNLLVREATSLAIDRETLCEARGFGIYTPAYQFYPAFAQDLHIPDDDPEVLQPYNPEKAKELLAEAGYPDGVDLTIYATTEAPGVDTDIMEAIASMLTESGIRTKTQYMPNSEWITLSENGWFDGFSVVGAYTQGFAMSNYEFGVFDPKYISVKYVWRPVEEIKPLYDDQMSAAVTDPEKTREIHRLGLRNITAIPVYNITTATVTKPYVHGGGFGEYDTGSGWRPDTLWLEQDQINY